MADNFFVRYPLVARILGRMLDIVADCPRARPEGLTLVADSNNGKSHTIWKFSQEMWTNYGPDQGGSRIPVLTIQAPVNGVRKDLFGTLARSLRIPLPPRSKGDSIRARIVEAMDEAKVRALCVDELHHILPGGPHRQRIILDDLKCFGNELQIPIFLAGTAHAHYLVSRDDQYHDRFRPLGMPRWNLDREFVKLLRAIEQHAKVAEGSFTSPQHAELIWSHSRGLLGRVFRICEGAEQKARLNSTGTITVLEINMAGHADIPWLELLPPTKGGSAL
jgi:hypothetical protein